LQPTLRLAQQRLCRSGYPVIGRKGGVNHRKWGRVFTRAVIITGCFALGMSLLTLRDPMVVHPHLVGQFDAVFLRGVFGWMMLHNAILTITLGWYGWLAVLNRRDLSANRTRSTSACSIV